MKDILLLAAVSLLMTMSAALPTRHENVPHINLPEVQITGKRLLPVLLEMHLPEVTIHAAKPKVATVVLPEVVITATRLRKV